MNTEFNEQYITRRKTPNWDQIFCSFPSASIIYPSTQIKPFMVSRNVTKSQAPRPHAFSATFALQIMQSLYRAVMTRNEASAWCSGSCLRGGHRKGLGRRRRGSSLAGKIGLMTLMITGYLSSIFNSRQEQEFLSSPSLCLVG
jgi:hypothetical protein